MITLSGWPLQQACQPGQGSAHSTSSLWLCSFPRRHDPWSPHMPFPMACCLIWCSVQALSGLVGKVSSTQPATPLEKCSSLGCNVASWVKVQRGCWRSSYHWIDTIMSSAPSTEQIKLFNLCFRVSETKGLTFAVLYLTSQERCISACCVMLNTDLGLVIGCETG